MRQVAVLVLAAVTLSPIPLSVRAGGLGDASAEGKAQNDLLPSYYGRVVSVTGEAVTIKPEGVLKFEYKQALADGAVKRWERVQDNTEPPRTFVFSDSALSINGTLPATKLAKGPISVNCPVGEHKISDLRPGDVVWIGCQRFRGIDLCTDIRIQRRPGGKVPPAIGDDKASPKNRIDNGANAAQFGEETLAPKWIPWMLIHFSR
jgi:hypothetical protein